MNVVVIQYMAIVDYYEYTNECNNMMLFLTRTFKKINCKINEFLTVGLHTNMVGYILYTNTYIVR